MPLMHLFTRRTLLTLVLALVSGWARAETLAVIVHPSSGVDSLSREEVSHLFLGRIKHLPSGTPAVVLDTKSLRADFYRALVNREMNEISAYWARLKFSGRTQPPEQIDDAESVLKRVAAERGAIGYIDAARVDKRVRVVLLLEY
jgi:ABC-type phosphate transport system substrate-binding protein